MLCQLRSIGLVEFGPIIDDKIGAIGGFMGFTSGSHWIILLIIVILLFGARRLPELGRSVGEAIRGFKKGLNEDEIDVTETKKEIKNDKKT